MGQGVGGCWPFRQGLPSSGLTVRFSLNDLLPCADVTAVMIVEGLMVTSQTSQTRVKVERVA